MLAGLAAMTAVPAAVAAPAIDPIFAAIEAFRRADAEFYADGSGDIPDEVGDQWSRATDAVIRARPTTPAGLVALTSFAREMAERSDHGDAGFGDRQWAPAMAAIDNATRGMSGLKPWSPPVAPTSDALSLVERCRSADRRWDTLADKITAIEEDEGTRVQYGRRPIPLIAWRNYSHIGGSELERARDEFTAAGIPANVVRAEYEAAKKREREIERAGEEWDRKVGLTDVRKEFEDCRRETLAAWKALGKVPVTSVSDATAIIGLLRERMRKFDELSDDWEVAAFMNASHFLAQAAA
jgi:hypothetical protein